ncbi:aspartyl aminopeptidase [Leptolyngbya sp. Heron Island J]|uniref:DUF3352 domain-containing protein n=1 Tax=Leptolyngbya sp. Heron Island J TaxID=1385935 RepID=UPI0003B99452|nr:DUF3352 domain-containing protein [Leptolyngbya sp. Heron Island J]ESA34483.1 aspartyl aminopeptidase [Leptolyngbya sp. Heron Island J]
MVLKQRPPLLVTVSTAVLLVLGGAAAYFGIVQRLSTEVKLPAGMELVPDNALVTLTLTTDENQWNRLRQLGTPASQKIFDQFLVTWRDRILTANGYRFRTDIQPWVGKQVTLAFLPKTGEGENATEMVLVAPIADPLKAQEIMAEPQDGTSWVGRDYQGVGIQSIKTATGETFESAILGNEWLVMASGAAGIEAVIDSFAGGAAMVGNNAYQTALKQLKTPVALVQMYVNVPRAADAFVESDNFPSINGLVAAATVLPRGLDVEAATWLGPEDQPLYQDMVNTQSLTPQRLPDSTVLMLSTSSIGPLWQALSEAEDLNALLPISATSLIEGLNAQTGLDFDNDLLPWLSGEVAFGLLPPSETGQAAVPMGQLALVAEVSDREAAAATWEQLNEVMVSRFRFDVESSEVESQPINQLVSYYGGIAMGHGWLSDDVTFFGVGADVLDAIAPQPSKPIQANPAFQTLLDLSPQNSSGYFFLDVERLEELEGTLPFPPLPDAPLFSAIQTIGVTTSVIDERSLRYDAFIELPKGRRVGPLPQNTLNSSSEEKAE